MPAIASLTRGVLVRLRVAVAAGGGAVVCRDGEGVLRAWTVDAAGARHELAEDRVLVTTLVGRAWPGDRGAALLLPRGPSDWRYLECRGTRFDAARFDEDRFSGGRCAEVGVFDASLFAAADGAVDAVFGPAEAPTVGGAILRLSWARHRPGALEVNLPAELPSRYGGRFNEAFFASGAGDVERYNGAVMEPAGDADDLAVLVAARAGLVTANHVTTVPLGWSAVRVPVRAPVHLTRGAPGRPAAIYLQEDDAPDLIALEARAPGEWGNRIAVTARPAGPARFDVTVELDAGRFESARAVVTGPALTGRAAADVEPGPVGLLQAKAAGVRVRATRDGADPFPNDDEEDCPDA